jgi:hypothetical protein
MLFSVFRDKNRTATTWPGCALSPVRTNDKPQSRANGRAANATFSSAATQAGTAATTAETNEPAKAIVISEAPRNPRRHQCLQHPSVLFADATAGVPEPKHLGTHLRARLGG